MLAEGHPLGSCSPVPQAPQLPPTPSSSSAGGGTRWKSWELRSPARGLLPPACVGQVPADLANSGLGHSQSPTHAHEASHTLGWRSDFWAWRGEDGRGSPAAAHTCSLSSPHFGGTALLCHPLTCHGTEGGWGAARLPLAEEAKFLSGCGLCVLPSCPCPCPGEVLPEWQAQWAGPGKAACKVGGCRGEGGGPGEGRSGLCAGQALPLVLGEQGPEQGPASAPRPHALLSSWGAWCPEQSCTSAPRGEGLPAQGAPAQP